MADKKRSPSSATLEARALTKVVRLNHEITQVEERIHKAQAKRDEIQAKLDAARAEYVEVAGADCPI